MRRRDARATIAFVTGFGDLASGAEELVGQMAILVTDVALDVEGLFGKLGSCARLALPDSEVQKNLAGEFPGVPVVAAGALRPAHELLPGDSDSEQADDCLAQSLGPGFNVLAAFQIGPL